MSDDFLSLVEEQLAAVRRLVEQLDDDQVDTQQQEAARRTVTINISDEEQSSEQAQNEAGTRGSQPNETKGEQLKEENPQEPVHTGDHQQGEPRPTEPEPERLEEPRNLWNQKDQ